MSRKRRVRERGNVIYINTNMNLDIEDDGHISEYDLNYTGPLVFLSAGF